jgi:hypothetical protein
MLLRDAQEYLWSGSMANVLGLILAVFSVVVAIITYISLTRMTARNIGATKKFNVEVDSWMDEARHRYAKEKLVPVRKRKVPGERTVQS